MPRAVSSGRKRTNLFNWARIEFALAPFMPSILYFGHTSMTRALERMHATGIWYMEMPHIVGQLKPIQDAHFALREDMEDKENFPLFHGKTYVVLPGISVDQTVHERGIFPEHIGYDLASERNRLSSEILRLAESLYHQSLPQSGMGETSFLPLYNEFLDSYRWLQLNDFLFPARVQMDLLPRGLHAVLDHVLEDLAESVNDSLIEQRKTLLGNTRKALDPHHFYPENSRLSLLCEAAATQVINDFALTVVESEKAHDIYAGKYWHTIEQCRAGVYPGDGVMRRLKDLFGTEDGTFASVTMEEIHKKITKVLTYDRWVLANAYATFFRLARPGRVVPYAKKTSYVQGLLDMVHEIEPLDIEDMGMKGIMRNTDMSVLGECDPSALRILENFLAFELEEFLYSKRRVDASFSSIYPSQRSYVEQFSEPEVCSDLITCTSVRDCSTSRCAKAFFDNQFTLDDIVDMLAGLGRSYSLSDARRLFDELRFSDVQRKALEDDTSSEKYILPGSVHQDLALLGSGKDYDLFLHNNENHYLVRSWIGMHGPDLKVEPLVIPEAPDIPYQLRASEFGTSCYLSRLLSKVDPLKLPETVDDNRFSIVGTATHKLWNQRPWLYYLERPDDSVPHVMDFCERRLAFVATPAMTGLDDPIVILGSADAVAQVHSKAGHFLMILDRKRANYYKQAFNVQTMTYNQAAFQMVARQALFEQIFLHQSAHQERYDPLFDEITGYITCINRRPFVSVLTEPTRPELVLGYAPVHAADELRLNELDPVTLSKGWVKGLGNIVRGNYLAQKAIMRGDICVMDYKGAMNKKGMCSFKKVGGETMDCLNKPKCDMVLQGLAEGRHWEDYFLDGVRL